MLYKQFQLPSDYPCGRNVYTSTFTREVAITDSTVADFLGHCHLTHQSALPVPSSDVGFCALRGRRRMHHRHIIIHEVGNVVFVAAGAAKTGILDDLRQTDAAFDAFTIATSSYVR